jgi:hypothetical protein
MINVRIRHEWAEFAAPLGQMPWTGAHSGSDILHSLLTWGLDGWGEDLGGTGDEDRLVGRFVVEDGEAYFEVMILEDISDR